ncbi:MAG: flagellar biosynthesis anti-sigma factor FlgM [Sporomusaceae bacterium]|nr:flagellar biosynthesis anti-sigma factor FlgM [Sporomusaceae bacterium]
MIVSGSQIQNALKIYQNSKNTEKTKGISFSSTKQNPDQVVLSPQVQEFGRVLQKIQAATEVRDDKVAELSAQIDSGTYQVSGRGIAEKMLGRQVVDYLR